MVTGRLGQLWATAAPLNAAQAESAAITAIRIPRLTATTVLIRPFFSVSGIECGFALLKARM
jgi:hypothetical protein